MQIFTGRPHQIRIHLAALNHPLVGEQQLIPKLLSDNRRGQRIIFFINIVNLFSWLALTTNLPLSLELKEIRSTYLGEGHETTWKWIWRTHLRAQLRMGKAYPLKPCKSEKGRVNYIWKLFEWYLIRLFKALYEKNITSFRVRQWLPEAGVRAARRLWLYIARVASFLHSPINKPGTISLTLSGSWGSSLPGARFCWGWCPNPQSCYHNIWETHRMQGPNNLQLGEFVPFAGNNYCCTSTARASNSWWAKSYMMWLAPSSFFDSVNSFWPDLEIVDRWGILCFHHCALWTASLGFKPWWSRFVLWMNANTSVVHIDANFHVVFAIQCITQI